MFKDLTDIHPCQHQWRFKSLKIKITENLSWSSHSSTLVKKKDQKQRYVLGKPKGWFMTAQRIYVRGRRRSEYFCVRCRVCIAGGGEHFASCTVSLKTHRLSRLTAASRQSLSLLAEGQLNIQPVHSPSLSLSRPELLQQQRAAPEKMYNPQTTAGWFGGTATAEKVCLLGELRVTNHFLHCFRKHTMGAWLIVGHNPWPWQPDCHPSKINIITIDGNSMDIGTDSDNTQTRGLLGYCRVYACANCTFTTTRQLHCRTFPPLWSSTPVAPSLA